MNYPQLLTLLGILAALIAGVITVILRSRVDPLERERKRRLTVNAGGRLMDAMITGAQADLIFYLYTAGGVEYAASQDVSQLHAYLPEPVESLIGAAATVKYSNHNPANSILVCEEWSGLRAGLAGLWSRNFADGRQ